MSDFEKARGVVPWKEGDPLPEDLIQAARGNFEPLCKHYGKENTQLRATIEELENARDGWRFSYEAMQEEGYDAVVDHVTKLNELLEKNVDLLNRKQPHEDYELKQAQERIGTLQTDLSDSSAQIVLDNDTIVEQKERIAELEGQRDKITGMAIDLSKCYIRRGF